MRHAPGISRAVQRIALAVLLGPWGALASAQTVTATTGAVNGTVVDGSGAGIPGVAVSLSGPSLIAATTATTGDGGTYRLSAVPPGIYTLTFELVGFATAVREGIDVGLGFTATVDAILSPGAIEDRVTVSGAPPLVDVTASGVTSRFNAGQLAALPGSRDFFALLSIAPGVAMMRMDVGGNLALSLQDYTAYGLRATTGVNRTEVEGIRVGGATAASDNYFSDYGSFAEIATQAVGNNASMPVPGIRSQYVSKSGGNSFRAEVYADYQNQSMQSTNIDDDQLARGVAGGPGLDSRDVNRLKVLRDVTADAGGYLKKDKAWWYGSYRSSVVEQRYAWLLDAASRIEAAVGTAKATYQLTPRQQLIGYAQHQLLEQPRFFVVGTNPAFQTSDALPSLRYPVTVWKGEYTASAGDAVYLEARAGSYRSRGTIASNSDAPRIADAARSTVSGGAPASARLIDRPQVNGSISIMKGGWLGNHTFRIGGEYMSDRVDAPFHGYGSPCNCVSMLNNGVPAQVQLFLGPNVSRTALRTVAGFVDDTWRLSRRVTISIGLRRDRYDAILPEQQGPAGQRFAAIDPVVTFDDWGPRAGVAVDLTGDSTTVLKLHYGKFWVYPAPIFVAAFNPNASGWLRTYRWLTDANANGQWDPGEEGALTSVVGGSAATRLDPAIKNAHVNQASIYVERELLTDFGVRTGVVVNRKRQAQGTINATRPLDAYSVPITIPDPGADGRVGNADDGVSLTGYDLSAELLNTTPVNITTNLAPADSDYYTWELTANRHLGANGAVAASVTHTWSSAAVLGSGNDYTPNSAINSSDYLDRFTSWQAKVNAAIHLPLGVSINPVVRHQSGMPYARTFTHVFNYGPAIIKPQPVSARRTPNITIVDIRSQKVFRWSRLQVTGLFDIYNLFNSNADQMLTTSSGPAWLRPTVITGPRVARIGARVQWS